MCRVLAYLGESIALNDLLYKPDNSLVTQTYNPKLMKHMLNLAGFGCITWDYQSRNPELPFYYRTPNLPFYDENLKNLAAKIDANCTISHVRGIAYNDKSVVSSPNVHPFKYPITPIAFAHNGSLVGFDDMLAEIFSAIHPQYHPLICGTTDSEAMYALFLTELDIMKKEMTIDTVFEAVFNTIKTLDRIRKKHKIHYSSPLNFFISDGHWIVGSRFVFDYGHYPSATYSSPHTGYHSMWYTYGERYGFYEGNYQMKTSNKMQSIIIASEPLTQDTTTWLEVPEYSFIGAEIRDNTLCTKSVDIIL